MNKLTSQKMNIKEIKEKVNITIIIINYLNLFPPSSFIIQSGINCGIYASRTQEHQHFKAGKGIGSRKGNQKKKKKKVGFLLSETNPDSGKERFYLKTLL